MLNPTTVKYFCLNKNFLGGFHRLLKKARSYECMEVKGKFSKEGETLGYWDPTNMSMYCFLIYFKYFSNWIGYILG